MNTIALSESWDLKLDGAGNMYPRTNGSAIAQDVASVVRLFLGELWFDTTKGIPYYEQVLGHEYGKALVEGLLNSAAKTVPGVVEAKTTIMQFTGRVVTGTIQVIDTVGESHRVHF